MSTCLVQKFWNWLAFLKFLLLRPGHRCQFSCWCFCYCLVLCLSTFCSVLGCLNITWKNFEFGITWHVHLNLPKSTAKVKKKQKRTCWWYHLSPVYTSLNIIYCLRGHKSSLIIIPEMLRQLRTFQGMSHWKALKSCILIVSRRHNRLNSSRILQNDVTSGISQISKLRPHAYL